MISYHATLDVPHESATKFARLLATHRRFLGTRRRARALTRWAQPVLILRWYHDATAIKDLARDGAIALATAYRYLHEGIDVLAAAPDLHQVIADAAAAGMEYLLLDATLITTDRVNDPHRTVDRWYSGKHARRGGNIQVIANPAGWPLWTSPVEPGSTHDLTCARTHAFPALYPAAVRGLPVLADKSSPPQAEGTPTGSGAGIRTPARHPRGRHDLDEATSGWNAYVNAYRAPVERSIAVLKTGWKALERISSCPQRIGAITAGALVLTRWQKSY